MQDHVTEVLRLGFGKCALQVQVPESGSIKTVDDLAGKRVVTSFEVLAGEYFDAIDSRLQLPGDKKTRIEYVGGSVEAACALGLADGIGRSVSSKYSLSAKPRLLVDLVGAFDIYSAARDVICPIRIWGHDAGCRAPCNRDCARLGGRAYKIQCPETYQPHTTHRAHHATRCRCHCCQQIRDLPVQYFPHSASRRHVHHSGTTRTDRQPARGWRLGCDQ